jgi:4-hydroxyphenylpyruvate dioxygenase-like putative hemolysin
VTDTRANLVLQAIDHWKHAGTPTSLHRWLGWSYEEYEDFEEYGVFPYPRPGAL